MLIEQRYAGWIGVKFGNWCANKDINFHISSKSMEAQLVETELPLHKLNLLYEGIQKQDYFSAKADILRYLKSQMDALMEGLAK